MPKPSEAELAHRATQATKILKKAIADGTKAEAEAENRSTGSRTRYKIAHDGAERALAVLLDRKLVQRLPKAPAPDRAATTRKPRQIVDPVPARRVSRSSTAKSNVVPINKAPSAKKKPGPKRKIG